MANPIKAKPITIAGVSIQPGEKISLALPCPELYSCAPIHIPVHVMHGRKKGPIMVVAGALHGDEISGISILQRLLGLNLLKSLRGTLIAIPVMNVYGLITKNQNLPDSTDLGKAFPGSEEGTFAARLARVLNKEIFSLATQCIVLHTGELQTKRWPQVHTYLGLDSAKQMAAAFQSSIVLNTEEKEGLFSLMHREKPIPTLFFETGEPLRLDIEGIKHGVRGIVKVMRHLEMLPPAISRSNELTSLIENPTWVVSHNSGLCRFYHTLGGKVKKGTLIARISDPFSTKKIEDVVSPVDGIVIAETTMPIVNEGEKIVQIGQIKETLEEIISEPEAK